MLATCLVVGFYLWLILGVIGGILFSLALKRRTKHLKETYSSQRPDVAKAVSFGLITFLLSLLIYLETEIRILRKKSHKLP